MGTRVYSYTVHGVSYWISTSSVGGPDPQDPHVFGPPGSGSGSISQGYGSESGSGSFPFLIGVLNGLK
jgi:hypothetical protein